MCIICPRTDFGTHLGVSIKLPLGAVVSLTNGPPPVEKTGIDEFPFLGKNTHIDKAKTQIKNQKLNCSYSMLWTLKEIMEFHTKKLTF